MRAIRVAAMAAMISMTAQPCLAAELSAGGGGGVQSRVGAFAGVRLGVPLGGARRAAPTARLQLGPAYNSYDASGALLGSRRGGGLELGATRSGATALAIGGQDAAALKRRLGFKGSTGYIVVGGVLLLLIVVGAAVAGATPRPGPSKGDF